MSVSRVSTAEDGGAAYTAIMLGALPAGVALNVGAGRTAPTAPGKVVINVDHSASALKSTDRSAAADVAALPFRDRSVDGVLLKDVLEHVPDPIAVLGELRRVASPTATMIMTVPRAIPRAVWADPTHIRGFTSNALVAALRLSGWDVVRLPTRIGGIPLAGRFPWLLAHAEAILKVPVLGHYFGTNWQVTARPQLEPLENDTDSPASRRADL